MLIAILCAKSENLFMEVETIPEAVTSHLNPLEQLIASARADQLTEANMRKLLAGAFGVLASIAEGGPATSKEGVSNDSEARLLKLLDHLPSVQNPELLTAAFLRFLPHHALSLLRELPWRQKVASLFDQQLGDTVYRERSIDRARQAHEKLEVLARIVKEHEAKLREAISLTNLNRFADHRQRVFQVLNNSIGRALFHPFLPHNIVPMLTDLYRQVDSFTRSPEDLSVRDAYTLAKEDARRFVAELEQESTEYSQLLAQEIGTRLLELLDAEFKRNKAVQPAKVSGTAPRDKKYPLQQPGTTLTIGLVISNHGPGYAYEVTVELASDDTLKLDVDSIQTGNLAPGTSQLVDVSARVERTLTEGQVSASIRWSNFDGTPRIFDFDISLQAQRTDIDWDTAARTDPYSLEPVEDEAELVGRRDVLNRLIATTLTPSSGSSIIRGQKRVGKTSIAKALFSHLERSGCVTIYLEGGDYVQPSAERTLCALGARLCDELRFRDTRLNVLQTPSFTDGITPLIQFLNHALRIIPESRFVFILDEFDELPVDLYTRGGTGDAFFLSLRAATSRRRVAFILVGGEKMAQILDCQGDQLNRWEVIEVGYFSRDRDWSDYTELITRPVRSTLEFNSDALVALHDATAGNPFFTKMLCRRIFQQAVERRDCYVTTREVDEGLAATIRDVDRNTFQHFWEDGIFDSPGRTEEKSIRRRKILIAVSDSLHGKSAASLMDIERHQILRDLPAIDEDLHEFSGRNILVLRRNGEQEEYDFKVPLFARWLKDRGVHDLIATFRDPDIAVREREQEERLRVSAGEIVDLVKTWPSYCGQRVSEIKVRAWLEQFGDLRAQRAMFRILKNLRIYSNEFAREKMREVDAIVKKGGEVIQRIESGKMKRSDILVSYLDGPGKSGSFLARTYADEAAIYVDNVVEKGKLPEELEKRVGIQALVFVDDFVGTGQSAEGYLRELDHAIGKEVIAKRLKVVFVAVVAYIDGWRRLQRVTDALTMGQNLQLHACEHIDKSARCFDEKAGIFEDAGQRELAEQLTRRFGAMIEKRCPMGYGDLSLAVVFERGCPNNSLPILWCEATSPRWLALFPRH